MKKLMKKFEDLMVAITFAEAGEYDVANQLLKNETEGATDRLAETGETSRPAKEMA